MNARQGAISPCFPHFLFLVSLLILSPLSFPVLLTLSVSQTGQFDPSGTQGPLWVLSSELGGNSICCGKGNGAVGKQWLVLKVPWLHCTELRELGRTDVKVM